MAGALLSMTPSVDNNEERPATRPRRVLAVLLGFVCIGAVGGGLTLGYRWLTTTPRLALRQVLISGNARVTRAEILERGGLVLGTNLFRLSAHAIEGRLASEPWIASAQVSRRLPDTMIVTITEKKAAAVVMTRDRLYLADAEGRLFKRAAIERGEGDGLVVVSGIDAKLFAGRPEVAGSLVRLALSAAALWRAGRDRPALGEVHLSREGITLYTLEGAVAVALGAAPEARLADSMARFDSVWAALAPEERAAVRTIHLDSRTRPDRVTVAVTTR